MAANGCAEHGPDAEPSVRRSVCEEKVTAMLATCPPWINGPLTLCSQDSGLMRTLRIERSGSTESVVITSGVDSCQSSGSSRPVTPQPMPPGPTPHCPYECLRDSEDSGLGPSPAKSLASSPGGPVSPVPFGDDRSDSLLDLSPRSDEDDAAFRRFCCPQFLLAATAKSCRLSPDFDEPSSDDRLFDAPTVVLIRSDFAEESRELPSSDCTSSNCSQAGAEGPSRGPPGGDDGACKWLHCTRTADANTTATDLVDHIRQCHVQSQPDDCKSYVCLWVGCKVFDRPSCSRSWLERHVLLHGGSKPFRCIVDGCPQRFGSEAVLERHVNSHFPQSRAGRLCRRRRHKHLRRPQSNKSKDYFDDATMEHVRHNLYQLSSVEGIVSVGPPSAITFHSTIVARRVDKGGRVNVLLRWTPDDVLPDSWVAEDDILSNLERSIPLSKLPPQALQLSSMATLTKAGILPRPMKRKRK